MSNCARKGNSVAERKGVGGRQKRGNLDDVTPAKGPKLNLGLLAIELKALIGNESTEAFYQENKDLKYQDLCQAYVDRIAKAKRQESANQALLIADQQEDPLKRHDAQVSASYIELNGGWLCPRCLTLRADSEESCGRCATDELQDILALTH